MRGWFLCWLLLPLGVPAEELAVATTDGEEIPVVTHPAAGDQLLLWFASEAGPRPAEEVLADTLAARGVSVWRPDLLAARFLPLAESSFAKIPPGDVAAVLDAAVAQGARQVYVVASGRSAMPVLRGLRHWQAAGGEGKRLTGVILISPKLFVRTPPPGEAGELLPIVHASNLPIYWLQPALSPWYWQRTRIYAALQAGGSDVFLRVLHRVRDRFYFRRDANPAEQALSRRLPILLETAMRSLASLPARRRVSPPLQAAPSEAGGGRQAGILRVFSGDPEPPPLRLPDLDGREVALGDYRGQVVLVNFWASWCPPCVHEMPSMQRLADALAGQPFTILAVNMAEQPQTVRQFLREKVKVAFPVLLDSQGEALGQWRVYAFPTSFIIDRRGRIRYALFGAAEWDDPAIIKTLRTLLDAK